MLYLIGPEHLGVVMHPVHHFLPLLNHRSSLLLGVTLSLVGSFLLEVLLLGVSFFLDQLFSVFSFSSSFFVMKHGEENKNHDILHEIQVSNAHQQMLNAMKHSSYRFYVVLTQGIPGRILACVFC